jgi:pilus assembly protein CpaE
MQARPANLTALLVSPDSDLTAQFTRTLAKSRTFQVLGELKEYPPKQALEMRLRQLRPDVLLIDVGSNLESACELIRASAALDKPVPVVGLHKQNDSDAVVRSLRAGAIEFLYAPFDSSTHQSALARITKIVRPDDTGDKELGKIVAFSSTKPGSGASMLAMQTAFALARKTRNRVLLADLDVLGGAQAFYLRLDPQYSVIDVMQHSDRLDTNVWSSAVLSASGIDVLAAPDAPWAESVESARLHDTLQFARLLYDWVVVDLPAVFHRMSLMSASEADRSYLVTTTELASLHLARKAVKLLNHLGFDSSRFQVLINRVDKKSEFNGSDIGKLLECPVDTSLPNDFLSLNRAVTAGEPLPEDCELGRAIDVLAGKLSGAVPPEAKGVAARRMFAVRRPLFSQL